MKRSGTRRKVCNNDIFRRLSGLLFYALKYYSCSPQKKWGRFAFLTQFRNSLFIEYPFNLDDMNKCGLYIKVEISIVHKKQPPFFMYVKEDSDML